MLPESNDDDEEKIRMDKIKAFRMESVRLSPDGSALNPQQDHRARVFPYIGDYGLTCMRKNCVPSPGIYDPLAPVDPTKLQKLKDYIKPFENIPLGRATAKVDYYRVIITERKHWQDRNYGWLFNVHVCGFLRVLRNRFKQDPCPFHNKHIVFIDMWFVSLWVKEYDQFKIKPKRFKFKDTLYEKVVNGLLPEDQPTNMKWIKDVDHLYIIPQTGGNHWVALHVDLRKGHIDCYYSIVGQVTKESEHNMLESCRPFTRMIPTMMNDLVPTTISEPSFEQFTFRKRSASRVSQNVQVGDCGVYAGKFFECRAWCNFRWHL